MRVLSHMLSAGVRDHIHGSSTPGQSVHFAKRNACWHSEVLKQYREYRHRLSQMPLRSNDRTDHKVRRGVH